jgi:hypothetical protein
MTMRLSKGKLSHKVLQDYFEALADSPEQPSSKQRARQLLASYAELRYRLSGGSRCPLCRAHVRHVVPVTVYRKDGSIAHFTCLCHRCLEGERAEAEKLEMRIGNAEWVM